MLLYVLVGIALSMDAFAVSVSAALCTKAIPGRIALRASFFFGFFQWGMPILGWLLGAAFKRHIQDFDHWIALALLSFVGGKMIVEGLRSRNPANCPDPEDVKPHGIMKLDTLFILALATSIDALAVGLSYSIIDAPILLPSLIIGLVTFAVSFLGIHFGKKLRGVLEEWAEILGGLVLILIGLKILVEHLIKDI
jgi:putative Mn2+ efflux pump MntP